MEDLINNPQDDPNPKDKVDTPEEENETLDNDLADNEEYVGTGIRFEDPEDTGIPEDDED